MMRTMLKAKIHRAVLTGADLDYEGSLSVDRVLLDKAGILPGEQVHVFNINNGARLTTYAIEAPPNSGTMLLNGAAARMGVKGDKIIVVTFAQVNEDELPGYTAKVVLVNDRNKIKKTLNLPCA